VSPATGEVLPCLDAVAARVDRTAVLLTETCAAACRPAPAERQAQSLRSATQAAAGLAESLRHLGAAFADLGELEHAGLAGRPVYGPADLHRSEQEALAHLHLADRWLDAARQQLLGQMTPLDGADARATAAKSFSSAAVPANTHAGPLGTEAVHADPNTPRRKL
jgi:hypothetical protein